MAGFVLFCKSVLSIVICCNLIVSSSKTATTHSRNVKTINIDAIAIAVTLVFAMNLITL